MFDRITTNSWFKWPNANKTKKKLIKITAWSCIEILLKNMFILTFRILSESVKIILGLNQKTSQHRFWEKGVWNSK